MVTKLLLMFAICSYVLAPAPLQEDVDEDVELLKKAQKSAVDELSKWGENDHKTIVTKLRDSIRTQYGAQSFGFKPVPKKNHKETLNVTLMFMLREIAKVKENTQKVTLTGNLMLTWHDEYITWEPSDFNNIRFLKLGSEEIWIPPVRAVDDTNVAQMYPLHYFFDRNLVVHHSGRCISAKPVSITFRCPAMDYGNFPNDVHTCMLGFMLDHFPDRNAPSVRLNFGGDLGRLIKNEETDKIEIIDHFLHSNIKANLSLQWQVVHFWRNQTHIDLFGKHLFSTLRYNIQFKRKAHYFGLAYVLPIFMGTVFLILTFIIPLGSQQRYWMALGGFVCLCLTYNRLYDNLPKASTTVPKIIRFYGLTLIVCLLTILESSIFHRIIYQLRISSTFPPPMCIQSIMSLVGRFVCYRSHNYSRLGEEHLSFDLEDRAKELNGVSNNEQVILEMAKDYGAGSAIRASGWEDVVRILDSLFFVICFMTYVIGMFALLF